MVPSPPARSIDGPSAPADAETTAWLAQLRASGPQHETALSRLHELLLRVAFAEVNRRGPSTGIAGPELDDLAHQAASDAMLAILAKLDSFRGESRFTTWAYRFVVLEVSGKLGRHYWRKPHAQLDVEEWERLPGRLGAGPEHLAEQRELIDAVRQAVDETLTGHQRGLFVAIVLNGVPLDALVAQTGSSRGAIYKTIADARRKIRLFLVANGQLGTVTGTPQNADEEGES
ncbi:sigma-70 family RNA polymerase sigma factor [Flexivirga alba]|uniref:Sigma-70 family RNA polymerase sigma factor n=1 Tax=Flexivirga alba TaxID=702742 RepID=A0ABW2ACN5_9MICO